MTGVLLSLSLAPTALAQTATAPAVVLVSGFTTQTPFSTSAAGCAGKEGPTWGPPGIVASTLKAAGLNVFTAPIANGGGAPPAPCTGPGQATPPQSAVINSNGDVNDNGAALAQFLAFLRSSYGVTSVQLVGHSDGGLWSRSAITQDSAYAGVSIPSLTTLGTPHTGSFAADLGVYLNNGQCDTTGWIQDVCEVFQSLLDKVLAGIGPVAVEQLTSTFLATWNKQQQIGSCPVTGYAGTYEDFSYIPFEYLNPSDGVVGQASALNTEASGLTGPVEPAPIPGFTAGGSFPVVHSASLSFLSPNNELNSTAIATGVKLKLQGLAPGGPLCTTGGAATASIAQAARPVSVDLPLRAGLASTGRRGGLLETVAAGDEVIADRRARVSCRGRELRGVPLFGDRRLRLILTGRCSQRLRVRGGRTLLASTRSGAHVRLRVSGRSVRLSLRRGAPGPLRLEVRRGSRWRTLRLDRRGRATLPGRADTVTVRITGGRRGATRVQGTTLLSLGS